MRLDKLSSIAELAADAQSFFLQLKQNNGFTAMSKPKNPETIAAANGVAVNLSALTKRAVELGIAA